MAAFLGMRGTGDWASNQVPEDWARYILYEKPNGSAPIFAMQSMYDKETVDSYAFHWWTKTMPLQAGDVSGVYIDAGLGTAYDYSTHSSSHGVAGATVYVKVAESLAKEFKPGHVVLLRDSDQLDVDVRGKVTDVVYNGSSSYIAVKLIEADDNHSTPSSYNLSTVDRILIVGSAYPEGSVAPEAIAYNPVEYSNYVQNFRTTLDLTHTALATALRTGDAYKEAKREIAELHSIEIEKALIWGKKYNGIGDNGKPERFFQGILPFLKENNPSNISNYTTETDSAYSGKTWLQAGRTWLNDKLSDLATYIPGGEILALCGNKALLGIEELSLNYADVNLKPGTVSYGIRVTTWITSAITVHLKTHPLFSYEPTNQNMMLLLLPGNVKFCPLVGGGYNFDTRFEEDMQIPGQHAKVDGFSTKGGPKFYFPNQFMVLYGVGEDNVA